jgi:hypothetical protein
VGALSAVAALKSHVFPLAVKVPALEFVPAVMALKAVLAVAEEVNVQSVLWEPELSTHDTVIFEPAMKLTVGR